MEHCLSKKSAASGLIEFHPASNVPNFFPFLSFHFFLKPIIEFAVDLPGEREKRGIWLILWGGVNHIRKLRLVHSGI
jgi:hypothetical protein